MSEKISHLKEDGTMRADNKKRTEVPLPNGGRVVSYRPYESMQIIFYDIKSPDIPDMWKLGFRKGGDERYLRTLLCRRGSCDFTINGTTKTLPEGQVMMDYGLGDEGTFTFTAESFTGVEIAFQPNPLVKESPMFKMLRFVIEGMMLPEEEIFDSDGYVFRYSKNTGLTLDKLLTAGLEGESILILAHTVEIGHNLGTDLKKKSGEPNDKRKHIADDIYRCLTEDFGTKYTAVEFAEKYGVSDTAVKKYFKSVYGYGFKEYQTKVRMEWAAKQLEKGDLSIGDISEQTGYSKHTKFTVAFRNYYGVTPSEYRRSHFVGNRQKPPRGGTL